MTLGLILKAQKLKTFPKLGKVFQLNNKYF